jgi:ADP-ribosyl-[dinitrogen reductase] hydrolase
VTNHPPTDLMDISDRAQGCLLGLAVGDALGATLEFATRDSLPRHTEMTGGGPHRLAPGQWTDDTSMALALGDSLLACNGLDASDLMERFQAWFARGEYSCTGACFDIGRTTAEALFRFSGTGDPWAGSVSEYAAGNGSLMRLAPAALFALHDDALALRLARDQSRTTHGAPQAVEACALFAAMLREAVLGAGKNVLRSRPWPGHQAVSAIAAGGWRGKDRSEISSSGYVIHTLEAALWCVDRSESFEAALALAVNLGDDADTVGAVTGQLAGAIWGAKAIPERWLAPLAWRERIEALALALTRGAV